VPSGGWNGGEGGRKGTRCTLSPVYIRRSFSIAVYFIGGEEEG